MHAYPQAGDPQISKVLKKQAKRNKKQYKKSAGFAQKAQPIKKLERI